MRSPRTALFALLTLLSASGCFGGETADPSAGFGGNVALNDPQAAPNDVFAIYLAAPPNLEVYGLGLWTLPACCVDETAEDPSGICP